MSFITVVLILLIISFFLALHSLRDIDFGKKVFQMAQRKKIRGSIIISRKKVIHYSKLSSSSESSKGG